MKGWVFDIQKFSLNDGPGIRTTVFLMGCKLQCQWCSNPESWSPKPQLLFKEEKCTSCGNCAEICPQVAVSIIGKIAITDTMRCLACGECVKVCSGVARRISGYQIENSQVMSILKKDIPYFNNSGGGLTLSGGEVLEQPEFASSLLILAKNENIHTCIETSGYGLPGALEKLALDADLILLDYKLSDDSTYQKYTNLPDESEVTALSILEKLKKPVWLRCPIIPGINDNQKHFNAINAISQKYENIVRVEILPYHSYGIHKYKETGIECVNLNTFSPAPELLSKWKWHLRETGCQKLFLQPDDEV